MDSSIVCGFCGSSDYNTYENLMKFQNESILALLEKNPRQLSHLGKPELLGDIRSLQLVRRIMKYIATGKSRIFLEFST
jgi:hypothetical protein